MSVFLFKSHTFGHEILLFLMIHILIFNLKNKFLIKLFQTRCLAFCSKNEMKLITQFKLEINVYRKRQLQIQVISPAWCIFVQRINEDPGLKSVL